MASQLDLFAPPPPARRHTRKRGDRTLAEWQSEQPGAGRWGEPGWAPMQGPTRLDAILGGRKDLMQRDAPAPSAQPGASDAPAREASRG